MEMRKSTRTTIKWGLYVLLLFFLCGLQSAPGLFSIWGVKPILVIPMAVAVAFFEREVATGIYGLLAGFLWDISAGKLFGFYGMVVMVCCVVVTLLTMYCIRVNLINILIACLTVSLLCGLWDYVFYNLLWNYEGVGLYFWKMLARTFYTTLWMPPIYYLVRWITGLFSPSVRA